MASLDEPRAVRKPSRRGLFTLYFENDLVAQTDDEYTAGVGLSWVSADVNDFSHGNFMRRMVDAVDFLPAFDDPTRQRHVSFILGQEIYTPEDISTPVPPPGQQPYAGVLFLDTEVHSRGPSSLHSWKLRLGVVGPSSLAEQTQTAIHKITSSDIPQGWDSQLSDEPLLNLDYRQDRRLYRKEGDALWSYDFTGNAGMGAGNYYIGANVGLQARFGYDLPATYGPIALRSGAGGQVGLLPAPGWRAYAYLEGQLFGVARFLPTDGNTFKDSLSGPREDFPTVVTAGLVIGRGRFLMHYAFNNLGGISEFPRTPSNDFGTLAISYIFW
jgi:hypothetical protein